MSWFCGETLPANSIFAFLHEHRDVMFPDGIFADLFAAVGRRSVPPSVVATVMVLQRLEGLSDREAVDRFTFDARWRYAAGLVAGTAPGGSGSRTPCSSTCGNGCAGRTVRTGFEVVDAEAGLQFAVVVFDPPPQFREPDQGFQRGAGVHVGQPVLDRFSGVGGPLSDQPLLRQGAVSVAGDVAVGETDPQAQEPGSRRRGRVGFRVSAAVSPGHLPCGVLAAARARSLNVTGGPG
ncbi:transposase [Dactylosporangium cerinum]